MPRYNKDGVIDSLDNCKNTFGPKENNGCPYKDTDKDGVLDKDDACPTVKGIIGNKGCPKVEIKKEETARVNKETLNKVLKDYAKSIYFNSGRHRFTEETFVILDGIARQLKQYPNAKILIEGHTDSVGSSKLNLKLSQERADEVKQYLVVNGILEINIEAIGYGESLPIATNKSKEGRELNRRVVIKVK